MEVVHAWIHLAVRQGISHWTCSVPFGSQCVYHAYLIYNQTYSIKETQGRAQERTAHARTKTGV